ncbi:MAG: hypothetical protein LBE15_05290 [Burkholderiales bacterium]|jgi:uncharacterized iron-regulated protein|nr:hypothetical protein [Burkholderiales bacterium]
MKLNDYIQIGINTTGSGAELSRRLDMLYNNFCDAKAEKRGLPSHACVKLAEIINADPLEVIAASEMVTEKKPERQALWRRVLEHRHAAAMTFCFALVTGFLTSEETSLFITSSLQAEKIHSFYIMSN